MTTTNDLTAIEGIDINCSYEMICIDRLNTKVNNITPTGIDGLIAQIAVLTTKMNNSYKIINVKDYGAIGDGDANDTTAINNATNALPASNGVLYLPKGTYKITSQINVVNKSYLSIISDNAVIKITHNGFGLNLDNCPNSHSVGKLRITTATTGLADTYAFLLLNCPGSYFKDLFIDGDFRTGIYLATNSGNIPTTITASIKNCRDGIVITGEYYEIANCQITGCNIGLYNKGGNNGIIGGHYNNNNIAIFVVGDQGVNADHGRIIGCTINHNNLCGIWLKNLYLSQSITGNQIWANRGGAGLSLATSVTARPYNYGLYMEGCTAVNVVGNQFMANQANLGYDGLCNSIISGNSFYGDGGRLGSTLSEFHIGEFGENNRYKPGFITENVISNNVFESYLVNDRDFIHYLTTYTFSMNNRITNNRGTMISSSMFIGSDDYPIGATYNIVDRDSYIIDRVTVSVASTSVNPADQSTTIYIHPYLVGSRVEISTFSASAVRSIWIRLKTTSNVPPVIDPSASGIVFYGAYNAFKLTNIPKFVLVPYKDELNMWVAYST